MKKLTVIVPVYNVEKYLDECISSLLSQTEAFDEIILINDGSTDQSEKICEKYCLEYSCIRLMSQGNRGQGAARNKGIVNATGDYVIFVDSDDYVSLDMGRKIKEYIHIYETDILYYNASMQYDIPAAEKGMIHSEELDNYRMTGKEYLYQGFPESYSASACLSAYRTQFLKDYHIFFPENTYFEDNLFSLRTTLEAESVCCIPDKLYIRRCRAGSTMMGTITAKKCTDMVSVQHSMWKYLKEKGIASDNAEFTERFIAAGVLHAVGYLNQAVDDAFKTAQIRRLVYMFFEMWTAVFQAEKPSFNTIFVFLSVLQELEKWNEQERDTFINTFWDSEDQYLTMQQDFRNQFRAEVTNKMKNLPFHKKGLRIGIYGTGRHTQAVLNLYRKLVGDIRCDLYFIVTWKTDDEFAGRPVLGLSECSGTGDAVIISSRLYQQEMKENLKREGIEEKQMIFLYQPGDICDMVRIHELESSF
ncbi:MAG: glycosyltransferase family 2 protein [Dorea sp.]|nr:glycosyltransferase family 2 protein [Dorea sp.]